MTTHHALPTRSAPRLPRRARAVLLTLATTGTALGVAAAEAGGQTTDPAVAPTTGQTGAADSTPPRVTPHLPSAIVGYGLELRPFTGALVPTGKQNDLLTSAVLVGGQLGWQFHPNFALTGSFGWSPSKDRTTEFPGTAFYTGRQERVDVFQYDLGLEARLPIATTASWTATPYVGLGGGGRSYRYRDLSNAGTQTNALGYGALGLNLAPRATPIGLRLEARDNVSAFKGLHGEYTNSTARNDVQFTAGLTYRF
ncbi:MAG TPA: hypothetical protein VGD56_20220 [Gemmatirosa sp.]